MAESINTSKGIRRLPSHEFPVLLREIVDPPKQLFLLGNLPEASLSVLAVVGSRKHTHYAREAIERIIAGLRGYPVAIVSGLALGVDAIAHEAAIAAGLYTLAVPGSGLDRSVLYPRSHLKLVDRILAHGGGLLSEYDPKTEAAPWTFPRRNRIMAGLSNAVLIVEASEKSGTLITARLAMEYNRDVLAVPGPITSANSFGPNKLIQDGAMPILSSEDILAALDIPHDEKIEDDFADLSEDARSIMEALTEPLDKDTLFSLVSLPPEEGNRTLLQLELDGRVTVVGGVVSRR